MDETDDDTVATEMLPSGDGDATAGDFGRPRIRLVDSKKPAVVQEAIEAIRSKVFQKANQLVRPLKTPNGVEITAITPEALDLLLNECCQFQKYAMRVREGRRVPVLEDTCAPAWLPKQICNLQTWGNVRVLDSIAKVPYLRPNMTVGGLVEGYDGPARCWSIGGTRWQPVSDSPTDDEARQAMATLADVVAEFPFANDSGLAVYLASVLTIVARRAINGPVPLIVIDSSTPGAGKTLLANACVQMAAGKLPGVATAGDDEQELRKAITGHLQTGDCALVFDNCTRGFGGATIDRFITSTIWSDRLLGTNKIASLANESVVLVTSNHATVKGDTARRSICVKLKPDCERPEERSFRYKDLIRHISEHQAELIHAALTILRWHVAKGLPEHSHATQADADGNKIRVPVRPFGSFEQWSRLVRHAVIGLGLPDPVQTAEAIRDVDETAVRRRAFLEALATWNYTWQGTSRGLIEELYQQGGKDTPEVTNVRNAIEELVGREGMKGTTPCHQALGYKIRDLKDRLYAGLTIRWVKHVAEGTLWELHAHSPES